jgi:hypothetical protein
MVDALSLPTMKPLLKNNSNLRSRIFLLYVAFADIIGISTFALLALSSNRAFSSEISLSGALNNKIIREIHAAIRKDEPTTNQSAPWRRCFERYEQLAKDCGANGLLHWRAVAMHGQAWCCQPDHDPERTWSEAIALYRSAINLYMQPSLAEEDKEIDPDKESGSSNYQLGMCLAPSHNPDGSWKESREYFALAVKQFELAEEDDWRARALLWLGHATRPRNGENGNWQECAALFEKSLSLFRATKNREFQAEVLYHLAMARRPDRNPDGSYEQLIEYLSESASLSRDLGQPEKLASTTEILAKYYEPWINPRGSVIEAQRFHAESAKCWHECKNAHDEAIQLLRLAECSIPTNDPNGTWDKPLEMLSSTMELAVSTRDQNLIADYMYIRACCIVQGGQAPLTAEASELFNSARKIYGALGNRDREMNCLGWISNEKMQ